MEGASHWTASRTAASVTRATAVPCATRRGSCSTPAVVCHANTVAARSQTLEMPFVTVRAAILGSSATPVGLHSNTLNGGRGAAMTLTSDVSVFQSPSVEESPCETSTRSREATLSARQHAWYHG